MGEDSLDALLKKQPRGRRSRVPGLKVADILTMPPKQQSLVKWLMRHYEARPQTIADHFEQTLEQVQTSLQELTEQGFLKTIAKNGDTYYQVRLAPKSGRQMPTDVWQVLDSNTQQANVFISYSRRNKEFVQELHSALEATGREVWVDWENIPVAVDWWQEIQLGIELADTFVFVLSPDSVASEVCGQEIDEAVKHNKRLVPLVHEDVQPDKVHPELSRLNWVFLRPQDDFKEGFKSLLEALDQNLGYVRTHTRLLVRALEWKRNDRDSSYLLRGADLEKANHYLAQGKDQEPSPTALHHQYVLASVDVEATARDAELERQRHALQEQRRWLQLVTAASILAGALGLTSLGLSQQAQQAQVKAEQAQLRALTQSSEALFLSNQRFDALLSATKAGRLLQTLDPEQQTPDLKAQVMGSLQQALFWVQERNRLEGHSGTVWQVAFSPDEQKLASASADGTIRLWNLDGQELAVLEGNGGPLLDLDFTPDGEHITAVDADGNLFIWGSDGSWQQEWQAHQQPTRAVDFSPDGQLIATASEDATVKLWNRKGQLVRTLQGDLRGLQALVWTRDNQIIAGDEQGTIYIWNPLGERLKTFKAHRAAVTALDVSQNGQFLASVGLDRQVNLYDFAKAEIVDTIRAHEGPIYNVRFTPDNQELITVGDDKLVRVWQLDGTPAGNLVGHTGLVAALAISPQGNLIATSGGDRAVRLWDLDQENLHILPAHRGAVSAVAIAPDRQLIASGGLDATLRIWNEHGRLLRSLTEHTRAINALAFSSDGQQLASASSDGTVRIWQQFTTDTPTSVVIQGHEGTINDVAFHPDGQIVATAGDDHTLQLWRTDGTLIAQRIEAHPDGLLSVAFSPDGKYLASTGWDQRVRIWTVDDIRNTPPIMLEGHRGWVLDAHFSPDGTLLATASYDNTVNLWQITNGEQLLTDNQLLRSFEGHRDGVLAVTFNPTGERLLTASNDNTIRIWNLDGALVTTLSGHTQGVRDIAIDSQSEFVVSASTDSTVLIWARRGMDNVDQLLHSSCNWLKDYLVYNDSVDPDTQALCALHNAMESIPAATSPDADKATETTETTQENQDSLPIPSDDSP